MEGKLVIFSAPSGAGKTTIVKYLLEQFPELQFSVSATTRAQRGAEQQGKDYYFLSKDDFLHKIANHEFVEFEEVYEGTYYGTLRAEIERIWAEGKHVIFDVDVVGGLHLKKKFGEKALAVFVQPPSVKVLIERLTGRDTDSEESLKKRIAKAEEELTYAHQFDVAILNDELDKACAEAKRIIKDFIE